MPSVGVILTCLLYLPPLCYLVLITMLLLLTMMILLLTMMILILMGMIWILEWLPSQPFRFLDLPPELRNMVYEHLSDRYCITRDQVIRRQERAKLADAFLYVNKQIYEEAMHVLVPRMNDVFHIMIHPAQIQDPPSTIFHRDGKSWDVAALQRIWHTLQHTRTIHLEIIWWIDDWLDLSEQDLKDSLTIRTLKEEIEMVCGLRLAKMPNLRTIKISFSGFYGPLCPPKHRIPGLLRPLKVVRRKNPGVVIELPEDCPISTAELAKQQRDIPGFVVSREGFEDMNERIVNSMALKEGRMTIDGAVLPEAWHNLIGAE